MSISPSLSPRQCLDRYAVRAGQNLPDKEFRYLRTECPNTGLDPRAMVFANKFFLGVATDILLKTSEKD
ncbi:hypothetical protein Fmac_018207 [Flemingia macrophylla]|uniref:Uncharacterized protein n=1 Tax=Flemingia macrophylla TaxID=520843 RepID=A0ABD1M4C4_9FABA